ncbi:sensor histidine kinase [Desulfovibrio sp. TomC]|uniref:sensor histidine kinase n=1 Tax=Desulfovibrio sp. TomC TaxID=1562888 RepID=UPI000574528F|nr:ATP-binding protein [Desulfovibrio sp. TomC]KHK02096.1 sensor histidine kinase [Desulfovibrio sp. TomC]
MRARPPKQPPALAWTLGFVAASLLPLAACLAALDPQARTAGVLVAAFLGLLTAVAGATFLVRRMEQRLSVAEQEGRLLRRQILTLGKLAAIGEMAAGVAHEINNPVAIMMEEAGLVLDILEDDAPASPDDQAEIRRALNQIRIQGARCKDITHMLLPMARKTDDAPTAIDLSALAGEMAALSQRRASHVQVRLVTDLATDVPPVSGSAARVQQVLLNLINNALDAMTPGGGELTITTRRVGHGGELLVSDTGHGIPETVIDRVFEPFFTTKARGKGTGLGLSISAGIVRELGGDISVRSVPGQGTTFRVALPAFADRPTPAPADAALPETA